MIASRAIMSMALAGVDLFAAIMFCQSSAGVLRFQLFLPTALLAALLLSHTLFCFYRAWQKPWDAVNLLIASGFVPTLCLMGVAVKAIVEIWR